MLAAALAFRMSWENTNKGSSIDSNKRSNAMFGHCTQGTQEGQKEGRGSWQQGLLGPLDGSAAEAIDAVWKGVALASVAVPPGKHNRLNASIQLRQRHLHTDRQVKSCATDANESVSGVSRAGLEKSKQWSV